MGGSEKGGRTLANLRPPPPLFALSDRQRRHCVPFSYSLFHFLFSFFPLFSSPNTAYCSSSVCVYWKERGEYDGPLQIEKPSRWQRSVTIAHYILLYSISRQRCSGPLFLPHKVLQWRSGEGGPLLWQEERLTMQISSPAAPLYSSFHGVWRRPQRARRRRRRRRRRQRLGSLSWIEEEGEENSKPINLGAACSERREPGQRKSRRFCLLLIIATCAAQDFTYILLTFDGNNFIRVPLRRSTTNSGKLPGAAWKREGGREGKK